MIPRGDSIPKDTEKASVPPDGQPLDAQPKWRRDFPIDWSQDEYVSRRDLVKFLVLTSAAFAAGQLYILGRSLFRREESALPAVQIAQIGDLEVGEALTFAYPEGSPPRLLVRTGPETFVAYDQQCTHLMCPVVPEVESGRLHCPCHNGWFDLSNGQPLAGPPRRPLPRIALEIRDGAIFATGWMEQG